MYHTSLEDSACCRKPGNSGRGQDQHTTALALHSSTPVSLDVLRRASIVLVLLIAGCLSATLPARYPSRPPAGMSAAQEEEERRSCVSTAANVTAERSWAYIGCLISKGHTVGVAFNIQGWRTFLDVTQTQPHAPAVVVAELEECRRVAYAARPSPGESTYDGIAGQVEHSFRACVEGRGYSVARNVTDTHRP